MMEFKKGYNFKIAAIAIIIGALLLHPLLAEPVDKLRIPVGEIELAKRLSNAYAIETAAQILSQYATNVVFEYNGADKRYVLRHSGIEITLPKQVIELLALHMKKAGLSSVLLTLRRNSKEDFKKAFMDLESLPHVSISEAFITNGIQAYTQFKKIILVPPYGDCDGRPLKFVTPHYGVETIAFHLNRECADVDARVYNPNLTSPNDLYDFIQNENPDIVAFSILYTVFKTTAAMIAELHQRIPQLKIALGGNDLIYFRDNELFNALPIFVCLHDNGTSLVYYGNNMPWEQIPNVTMRMGNTFKSTGLKKINDSPVDPREDMPLDKIDITHRAVYSESSSRWKGMLPPERIGHNPLSIDYGNLCKGKCIFCQARRNTHGPAPTKEILKQLNLYSYKYDSMILEALSFPLGRPEATHLLKEIMVSLFASIPKKTTMRADYAGSLTDLQLAKKAGVEIISYGIESFVKEVLQALNKGITVQQNITALNNTIAAGIRPGINLILFTPWDTIVTTDVTIQTALDYVEKGAYLNIQDGMDVSPATPLDDSVVEYNEISIPGMPSSLRIPSQGKIFDPSLRQLLPRIRKVFYELEADYQPEYASTISISSLIWCKAFYVALIGDLGMNEELLLKIERIDKAINTSIVKMEETNQKGMIQPFLYSDYKYIDIPKGDELSSLRMEEYMASKMPTEVWDIVRKGDAHIELHRGPISRTYAYLQFLREQGYSIDEILPAEPRIRKYYRISNDKETYYIVANNIGSNRELFIVQILYYFEYPQEQIRMREFAFDLKANLAKDLLPFAGKTEKVIIAHDIDLVTKIISQKIDSGCRVLKEISNDYMRGYVLKLSAGQIILLFEIEYSNGEHIAPVLDYLATDKIHSGFGAKEIDIIAACGSLNEEVNLNDLFLFRKVFKYGEQLDANFINKIDRSLLEKCLPEGIKIHDADIFTIPTVLNSSQNLIDEMRQRSDLAGIELELAHALGTMSRFPDVPFKVIYEVHDKPSGKGEPKEKTIGADVPGLNNEEQHNSVLSAIYRYFLMDWNREVFQKTLFSYNLSLSNEQVVTYSLEETGRALLKFLEHNPLLTTQPFIAIAGPSGTGKTSYVIPYIDRLLKNYSGKQSCLISGDCFVIPKSERNPFLPYPYNMFDVEMMISIMSAAKDGLPIGLPIYDKRLRNTLYITKEEISKYAKQGNPHITLPYYKGYFIPLMDTIVEDHNWNILDGKFLAVHASTGEVVEILSTENKLILFEVTSALLFPEIRKLTDGAVFVWSSDDMRFQNVVGAQKKRERMLYYTPDKAKERLRKSMSYEDSPVMSTLKFSNVIFINQCI